MTVSGSGPKVVAPASTSADAKQPSDPEQLVIVEIVDGIANQTLVHLPARRFHQAGWGPAFHNCLLRRCREFIHTRI